MDERIKRLQEIIDRQNKELKMFIDAMINKVQELELHLSILKDEIDEIRKSK